MLHYILILLNLFDFSQTIIFYDEQSKCIQTDSIPMGSLVEYIAEIYRQNPQLDHIGLVNGSQTVLNGVKKRFENNDEIDIPIITYRR